MVRQAQNYFAAAVSAAVLNAAAIAGFVMLTLLSGGHVLPLSGLLNASNPFQPAADSAASAPAPDLSGGGLDGLLLRSSDFAASDRGDAGGAVTTLYGARGNSGNSGNSGGPGGNGGSSNPQGSGSDQPASGGSPSSGGSDPGASGPSIGSPGTPSLPVPQPSGNGSVGQAAQQLGNAASNATSNLPGPVGAAVTAVTGATKSTSDGAPSGVTAPVKNATSTATQAVKNATSAATASAPAPVHTATSAVKHLPGL